MEGEYFQEDIIGEHVDCHQSCVSHVSSCSQVSEKDVRRLGLLKFTLVQRCASFFSVNKSSEWKFIRVKHPEWRGNDSGLMQGYTGDSGW